MRLELHAECAMIISPSELNNVWITLVNPALHTETLLNGLQPWQEFSDVTVFDYNADGKSVHFDLKSPVWFLTASKLDSTAHVYNIHILKKHVPQKPDRATKSA